MYIQNELRNGFQEKTGVSVVINVNTAQHYTYGYYEGSKNNVGEDIIGLAKAQNTGSIIESYFSGLDDSKQYTMRMFGQHLNRPGDGSINFARFGVNGDKKDTGPSTATCTWYEIAPTQGRIDFTLEYINPNNSTEYASLGGFQLQEEVSALRGGAVEVDDKPISYPLQLQISEEFVYHHEEGRIVVTTAAVDASDLPSDGNLYLHVLGLPLHNKILLQGEYPNNTDILAKLNKSGVLLCSDEYYDIFIPKNWVGTLRFGITVLTFENGSLVQKDLEEVLGRKPVLSVDFHFD